jgi:hypothetical protein
MAWHGILYFSKIHEEPRGIQEKISTSKFLLNLHVQISEASVNSKNLIFIPKRISLQVPA